MRQKQNSRLCESYQLIKLVIIILQTIQYVRRRLRNPVLRVTQGKRNLQNMQKK